VPDDPQPSRGLPGNRTTGFVPAAPSGQTGTAVQIAEMPGKARTSPSTLWGLFNRHWQARLPD